MQWIARIDSWAQTWASAPSEVITIFKWLTWLGSIYVLFPFTAVLCLGLVRNTRWREALMMMTGLLGTWAMAHLLKWLVSRARPEQAIPLGQEFLGFSFPSAHTAQITAVAGGLILARVVRPRPAAVAACALVIALVGASRVVLQAHFLSDVIGGLLFALLWLLILRKILLTNAQ